jgi:hypothetical protein
MNNKQKLNLAARVQKRIQEKHPNFRLIKKKEEIEKELNAENKNGKP